MNLFYQPLIPEGNFNLDPDEARHCTKVLRKRPGDTIFVTDGKGFLYEVVLSVADHQRCSFRVVKTTQEAGKDYSIHIAISPTKNSDRIEWFVEKATEFGIDKITLLETVYTERSFLKKDRLEKVAISAMKQSLKTSLPQITSLISFNDVIAHAAEPDKYIAFVDHSNPQHLLHIAPKNGKYLVLIGPEGDFSEGELGAALQNGFVKVSLGKSRLRTETAGIAACHVLNLINS